MFRKLVPTFFVLVLALTACGQKPAIPFSVESLNGKTVTLVSFSKDKDAMQMNLTVRIGSQTETVAADYFVYFPVTEVSGIHVGDYSPNFGSDMPYFYYGGVSESEAYDGKFPGFSGEAWVRIEPDTYVTIFVVQNYTLTQADKKIVDLQKQYAERRAAKAKLLGALAIKNDETVFAFGESQHDLVVGEMLSDRNRSPISDVPGSRCSDMAWDFPEWGMQKDLQDWYAVCGPIAFMLPDSTGIEPLTDRDFALSYQDFYIGGSYGMKIEVLAYADSGIPNRYRTVNAPALCEGQSIEVTGETLTLSKTGPWIANGHFLFDEGFSFNRQISVPAGGWIVVTPAGVGAGPETYEIYHVCK